MSLRDFNQLNLFPDLFMQDNLASITSLPEFDHAIENFIRIADYGAFLEIQFSGIDKSFSVSSEELSVKPGELRDNKPVTSPHYFLLPNDIRQGLNRYRYEVRSFFTRLNSFKTAFGYFLYRPYFPLWHSHIRHCRRLMEKYIRSNISEQQYSERYTELFIQGYQFLFSAVNPGSKWLLKEPITYDMIAETRTSLEQKKATLNKLNRDDPEYFFNAMVVKTMHIPPTLDDYIKGIRIISTFKTIHLEYLKSEEVSGIDDIRRISEKIWNNDTLSG